MNKPFRYYVRAPGGRAIFGFDKPEAAEFVALEYGVGAAIVDTLAQAYRPMLQLVQMVDGRPAVVYGGYGGWDTGRNGLDHDLIEAIRKGHPALVHAFLAKGASPDARDAKGGPALHWAAGRGVAEVVALLIAGGADASVRDAAGRSALDVAEGRGRAEIAALLRQKGAT